MQLLEVTKILMEVINLSGLHDGRLVLVTGQTGGVIGVARDIARCQVWYGMVWYGMVWYGMVEPVCYPRYATVARDLGRAPHPVG